MIYWLIMHKLLFERWGAAMADMVEGIGAGIAEGIGKDIGNFVALSKGAIVVLVGGLLGLVLLQALYRVWRDRPTAST